MIYFYHLLVKVEKSFIKIEIIMVLFWARYTKISL